MKRVGCAPLAGILSLLLCGCSLGTSVDSLLSPPRLTEEQNAVYAALSESLGSSVTLKYPRSGDYRSAFVIEDIDGEPTGEAIVFYETPAVGLSDSSLRLNILDMQDGKWRSVYDYAGAGTDIDRVIIRRLGSGEIPTVIIGYNNIADGMKELRAYVYDGGLVPLFNDSYSYLDAFDMDMDGKDELVTIVNGNGYTYSYVQTIANQGSGRSIADYRVSGAAEVGSGSVAAVAKGLLSNDTVALYVDLLQTDGTLTTELVYSVGDVLRNPFRINPELSLRTGRPSGYYSCDIDGDGSCEIPTISDFLGYQSADRAEKLYITDWWEFSNYSLNKKYSSFYSISEGYCFMLPARWEGMVTLKQDAFTGEYVFYKFEDSLADSTTELMRFCVTENDNVTEKSAAGYTTVASKGSVCYMVKNSADTAESLVLTQSEITNSFYIVNT